MALETLDYVIIVAAVVITLLLLLCLINLCYFWWLRKNPTFTGKTKTKSRFQSKSCQFYLFLLNELQQLSETTTTVKMEIIITMRESRFTFIIVLLNIFR